MASHQAGPQGEGTMPKVRDNAVTVLFDNTSTPGPHVDFVFIHGLNGHPQNTWTHANAQGGFYWPWELRKQLKKSRAMTFGYNAGVKSELAENFIRIKGIAASLTGALANKRTTSEEMSRPLVFIGHSMGGLVAKAAAVSAASALITKANDLDKLYNSIKGFVFFGTPHGGSKAFGKMRVHVLKKMAKAAFIEIPPKLEDALQSGSDELLDLADGFRKISLYVNGELIIASYYEQLATAALGDRVVDEHSAFVPYHKANDPEPINADHVGMVKFENADDSNYENVASLLERWETRLTESGSTSFTQNSQSSMLLNRFNQPLGSLSVLEFVTLQNQLDILQKFSSIMPPETERSVLQRYFLVAHPANDGAIDTDVNEIEGNSKYTNSRRPRIEVADEIGDLTVEMDLAHTHPNSAIHEEPLLTPSGERGRGSLSPGDEPRGSHRRSPSSYSVSSNDGWDTDTLHVEYNTLSSMPPTKQQPLVIKIGSSLATDMNAPSLLSFKSRKSVLCFDHGGIRSLTSLYILKDLMERLTVDLSQPNLLPCEIFDLIGGSSVGGLIAIMLGHFRLSVDQAIEVFMKFTKSIFSKRPSSTQRVFKLVSGGSLYRSSLVKRLIEDLQYQITGKHDNPFEIQEDTGCRTFVTAFVTNSSTTALLRNYSSTARRDSEPSCLVSEAILTCFAAPTYFDPVHIGDITVYDGGIGCGNPTILALSESKQLWNVDPDDFSAFVTIGSGLTTKDPLDGQMNVVNMVKIITQAATAVTSSDERGAAIFRDAMNEGAYYRFQVQKGLDDIGVDEYEKIPEVVAATNSYLSTISTKQRLKACASALSNSYIAEFLSVEGSRLGPELPADRVEKSLGIKKDKIEEQLRRNTEKHEKLQAELMRIEAILSNMPE